MKTKVFLIIVTAVLVLLATDCKKTEKEPEPWGVPGLSTSPVITTDNKTISGGGDITWDGGGAVFARGICWSTAENPTIFDSKTTDGDGMGHFISKITGFQFDTLYHVRAYATNSLGTNYGEDLTFVVLQSETPSFILLGQAPTATTKNAVISANGITLNGTVNANGLPTTITFQYRKNRNIQGLRGRGGPRLTIKTVDQSPVSGFADTNVSVEIPCSPGESYTYTVAAENCLGRSSGSTLSFTY